ncbi:MULTISPECIES: sigma-70 family RNA polymerase sigma factor [Lactobacillaceae]|uniref:sigma-70 family RNA polymerase sigma factor n=1 Tax=Lactobacillaceae TaxID=33958 RepID=UPI0014573AD0|nr:sigma-70 family RNA polymerase sigma factor [Lactobacillus sp. HBUAS51381]NLR10655.1 sigma-70 family RNA polymerase sigma factor [Lactobacillus sp. HBUAS51381]
MTRDTTAAYRFLFTGDHETIIYAALKRLRLRADQDEYDDYLQEGRAYFPQIYANFPDDPEEKPHQFLAYAQRALTWELGNQLRNRRRQAVPMEPGDHEPVIAELPSDEDVLTAIGLNDYRTYLLQLIGGAGSTGEWRFLVGTVVDQLTPAEIATKYNVNRTTVFRWRRSLTRRLLRTLTPPEKLF